MISGWIDPDDEQPYCGLCGKELPRYMGRIGYCPLCMIRLQHTEEDDMAQYDFSCEAVDGEKEN